MGDLVKGLHKVTVNYVKIIVNQVYFLIFIDEITYLKQCPTSETIALKMGFSYISTVSPVAPFTSMDSLK